MPELVYNLEIIHSHPQEKGGINEIEITETKKEKWNLCVNFAIIVDI